MAVDFLRQNASLVLGTGQTGNGDSTTTADRRYAKTSPCALVIDSTAGTTVTVNIQGSVDGTHWYNIPYALVATPSTFVLTALTITTTVVVTYLLKPDEAWRYLKVVRSANTGMTLTATLYA